MAQQARVHSDLLEFKGDKAKLMQKYSDELQAVINQYGGNLSDVPLDKEHVFYKIQERINILGRL